MSLFKNDKAKKQKQKTKGSNVAGSAVKVLSGLVAGVATTLLLAPQSGEKTRKQLKETANDLGETVSDKSREVGKTAKEQVNNVKDQVKEKTNL